ncbi:MAG: SGNH/GDSL hydrolase family protein [Rhodospirillales bacterium]
MKNAAANAVLVVVSLLAGLVVVEMSYRYYVSSKYSHADFGYTLIDAHYRVEDVRRRQPGDGLYLKNVRVNYRTFDSGHNLLLHSVITTNRAGYRSGYEYGPISDNEYRIAVIGDSMTASLLNDYPWTDVLNRLLNDDEALKAAVGVDKFTVYNFGVAGAGFETMAQAYHDHGERFSPQLAILNFITPDILRNHLYIEPVDDLGLAPRRYRGVVGISAGDITAQVIVVCDTPELSLGGPGCSPSRVIFMDPRHTFDKKAVEKVKLNLSKQFIWSKLWGSTYPYALAAAMGEPFVMKDRSLPDILDLIVSKASAAVLGEEESLISAAAAIGAITARQKNLIIMHNPTSGELLAGVERPPLAARLDGVTDINFVYMGEHLPLNGGEDEIKKWFNLPHDSHFNNHGADVYGKAVYRVVRQRLIKGTATRGDRPN